MSRGAGKANSRRQARSMSDGHVAEWYYSPRLNIKPIPSQPKSDRDHATSTAKVLNFRMTKKLLLTNGNPEKSLAPVGAILAVRYIIFLTSVGSSNFAIASAVDCTLEMKMLVLFREMELEQHLGRQDACIQMDSVWGHEPRSGQSNHGLEQRGTGKPKKCRTKNSMD